MTPSWTVFIYCFKWLVCINLFSQWLQFSSNPLCRDYLCFWIYLAHFIFNHIVHIYNWLYHGQMLWWYHSSLYHLFTSIMDANDNSQSELWHLFHTSLFNAFMDWINVQHNLCCLFCSIFTLITTMKTFGYLDIYKNNYVAEIWQ